MSIQCSLDITTWNGWSASVSNARDPALPPSKS